MKTKLLLLTAISLLTLTMADVTAGLPKYFYKKMQGTIGSEKVNATIIRIDTAILGSYYYERYGKPIEFSYRSKIQKEAVYIEEDNYRDANYKWNITGYFNGEFINDSTFTGTWTKPDSTKSYKFNLIESYPPGSVQFELFHKEKTIGVCDSPGCAQVSVTYPQMRNYVDKSVQDTINEFILSNILFPKIEFDSTLKNGRFDSADDLINDFIKRYKEDFDLVEDLHQYGYNWQGDYDLVVSLNEDYLLGLSTYEYNYLGGAHGSFMIIHHNIDLKTAKEITLSEIFIEGYEKKLNEIAEKIFRQLYEVPRRQNLESAGYWFENNRFRLNENFALNRTGITFQFNQYEIAPYAAGAPEIFIPWVKIIDLVKEGSVVRQLIEK